jgi:hypothetical protein
VATDFGYDRGDLIRSEVRGIEADAQGTVDLRVKNRWSDEFGLGGDWARRSGQNAFNEAGFDFDLDGGAQAVVFSSDGDHGIRTTVWLLSQEAG